MWNVLRPFETLVHLPLQSTLPLMVTVVARVAAQKRKKKKKLLFLRNLQFSIGSQINEQFFCVWTEKCILFGPLLVASGRPAFENNFFPITLFLSFMAVLLPTAWFCSHNVDLESSCYFGGSRPPHLSRPRQNIHRVWAGIWSLRFVSATSLQNSVSGSK